MQNESTPSSEEDHYVSITTPEGYRKLKDEIFKAEIAFLFSRGKPVVVEDPTDNNVTGAPRIQYFSKRYNVNKETHTIDFDSTVDGFTDPIIANACVEVMTWDYIHNQSTLSHLTTLHNPEAFAIALRKKVRASGIPVVLVGGDSNNLMSKYLVEFLIKELSNQGFVVSDGPHCSHLLGRFSRQSTVLPGKVLVHYDKAQSGKMDQLRELEYPASNYY